MTLQRAIAAHRAGVLVSDGQACTRPHWPNNAQVEVDQVRVVAGGTRQPIDPVRIVTCGAWGPRVDDVRSMEGEALVAQNAVAIVAAIAKGVGVSAFDRKISCFVVGDEDRLES